MKELRTIVAVAALLLPALLRAQETPVQPPAAPPAGSQDALTRAQEEELRARLQRDNWLITIERRGATVQEIVDEFRRQIRVSIVLDATNIPEEFRIDEFVVREVPFRAAFTAFLDRAGLMIDDESAELIRISRPPRVTVTFKNADISAVIDMIGRLSNANIILSSGVKGTISINMHDVPWVDVLESVAKTMKAVAVRERQGIIRIVPQDDLLDQMETRVFPLKYITLPAPFRANIQSGRLVFGKHPNPPAKEEEKIKGFYLKPALEAVLTRDLKSGKARGQLNFDPQTNAFIVTDMKPVLDRVEQILKVLDVEPAEVLVDIKFISTTNEDLLSFGTNFFFSPTSEDGLTVRTTPLDPRYQDLSSNAATALGGKVTTLPFGSGHEPITSSQYFLTEYDMLTTFRAFKRDAYTRLLQEPSLTCVDNELATIFVGEEVHYAVTEAEATSSGGLVFTVKEADDSPVRVGFQLMILPRIIRESNKVLMTIIPQNQALSGTTSTLEGFERFTLAGAGAGGANVSIDLPRITSQTVVTRMMLESGKTAVLGGLVIERSNLEDKKVPFLGDIPIVGYLFKQSNDTHSKEHLLIFVTPRIVRMDADTERIKEVFRQREESMRRQFDEMRDRSSVEKKEGGAEGEAK